MNAKDIMKIAAISRRIQTNRLVSGTPELSAELESLRQRVAELEKENAELSSELAAKGKRSKAK